MNRALGVSLASHDVVLLCRQRIVQALLPGETVLAALRRLGGNVERHSQDQAPSESKAARFAALRSRLAGTVPERNK